MLRNIHLHGELGDRHGKVFRLSVTTASEAVRALAVQLPGFGDDIRKGEFSLVRGPEIETGVQFTEEMLSGYRLGNGDLHIVPYIAGSKNGGLLKAILGVVIIGAAFALSGGALGTALGATGMMSGVTYGNVAMIGLAVAASGISTMMAPEEETEESTDSYLFSGPGNTYTEGGAIPLVYGEVFTGGVMISIGMDAEKLALDSEGDGKSDEERDDEDEDE